MVELRVVKKPLLLVAAPAKSLVELKVVKKPLVEVMLVPVAFVKVNNPLIVVVPSIILPSANTRKVLEEITDPTLNIEEVTPVEEENTDRPPWE